MIQVFVPPPQPSRKAKELGAAIAHLVLEYQNREGKLNATELRMAQQLAAAQIRKESRGQGGGSNTVVILSIVLGLILLAGVLVLSFALR
jgi:hypothetical protein